MTEAATDNQPLVARRAKHDLHLTCQRSRSLNAHVLCFGTTYMMLTFGSIHSRFSVTFGSGDKATFAVGLLCYNRF